MKKLLISIIMITILFGCSPANQNNQISGENYYNHDHHEEGHH